MRYRASHVDLGMAQVTLHCFLFVGNALPTTLGLWELFNNGCRLGFTLCCHYVLMLSLVEIVCQSECLRGLYNLQVHSAFMTDSHRAQALMRLLLCGFNVSKYMILSCCLAVSDKMETCRSIETSAALISRESTHQA